ncbi:hypothetical protein Q8A73_002978 [Channa argus]|nr:hypothetical protein Q8A73_002978 [Channa argus]
MRVYCDGTLVTVNAVQKNITSTLTTLFSMEATGKFDFKASADDELSFRQGESLKVLQTTGNWYKAEINGVEGFVPKNFININLPSWYQENAKRSDSEEMLMSQPVGSFLVRGSKSAAAGNFSLSVRHPTVVQHYKVQRDKTGHYSVWSQKFSSLNQLVDHYKSNSVAKQSQVFLLEKQQQVGTTPPRLDVCIYNAAVTVTSSKVEMHQTSNLKIFMFQQQRRNGDSFPPLPSPPISNPLPIPAPRQHKSPSTLQVLALYSFHAEEADELDFDAGDIINVLECSDQSWWKGQLRGKTGLFPTNYTKPI